MCVISLVRTLLYCVVLQHTEGFICLLKIQYLQSVHIPEIGLHAQLARCTYSRSIICISSMHKNMIAQSDLQSCDLYAPFHNAPAAYWTGLLVSKA